MKYRVITSDGNTRALQGYEADTMHRDGDWIMLTKAAPQMEERRINHPADAANPQGRIETVMVSTGRVTQQPIACFYKPILVELITPAAEEPSDGNDA